MIESHKFLRFDHILHDLTPVNVAFVFNTCGYYTCSRTHRPHDAEWRGRDHHVQTTSRRRFIIEGFVGFEKVLSYEIVSR